MVIGLMLLLRQRFFVLIVEMMIIQYEIWGPNPPMLTVDNESDGDILAFYIAKLVHLFEWFCWNETLLLVIWYLASYVSLIIKFNTL